MQLFDGRIEWHRPRVRPFLCPAWCEPCDQYMSRPDKIIGKLSSLIITAYEIRSTNRQNKYPN